MQHLVTCSKQDKVKASMHPVLAPVAGVSQTWHLIKDQTFMSDTSGCRLITRLGGGGGGVVLHVPAWLSPHADLEEC